MEQVSIPENIVPVKWNGQVVITTALLAKAYGASEQQIQQNFNNHKGNFTEGKHYILLRGDELRKFKNCFDNIEAVGKRAPLLYLWTERGANRHCKILDTDKAWEQFDHLEETYFNVKHHAIDMEQLDPQTKLMNLLVEQISKNELEQKRQAGQLKHIEEKQAAVEQKLETVTGAFQKTYGIDGFQNWVNSCIAKIAESPGFGKGQDRVQNYSMARAESYERLYKKRKCRLNGRVYNAIERAKKENPGIAKSQLQKINKLYIIANDKNLKNVYELVIKEMMACYCID